MYHFLGMFFLFFLISFVLVGLFLFFSHPSFPLLFVIWKYSFYFIYLFILVISHFHLSTLRIQFHYFLASTFAVGKSAVSVNTTSLKITLNFCSVSSLNCVLVFYSFNRMYLKWRFLPHLSQESLTFMNLGIHIFHFWENLSVASASTASSSFLLFIPFWLQLDECWIFFALCVFSFF